MIIQSKRVWVLGHFIEAQLEIENGKIINVLSYGAKPADVDYGEKRIYDVPIKLEKNNKIKLSTKDNLIKVYLNDELKIETIIPYMTTYGRVGLYKSSESLIKFKSFNFVEENL